MFEIINNTKDKVEELDILEEYIKYVTKKTTAILKIPLQEC